MTTAQRSGGPSLGVLAHPADIHCIIFHLLVLMAYGLAFWIWQHPGQAGIQDGFDRAAFVVAAALLLGWGAGIDLGVNFHNHAHRRIFKIGRLNRWFGRCWAVSSGWPAYFWLYSHVAVHHRHLLEDRDWTLPRRRSDGSWENYYRYCLLHWPWRYARHLYQEFHPDSCRPTVRRRARLEFLTFIVLWSLPFWYDPIMALLLWALPMYVGNVLILAPGMIAQHYGRERPSPEHTFRHSNTYVSPFFNLAMFNIGYHAEHHTFPYVHWAELPQLHERLKSELIEDGAHVHPFGYFRGGLLLSAVARNSTRARLEFEGQHPDYVGPNTLPAWTRSTDSLEQKRT